MILINYWMPGLWWDPTYSCEVEPLWLMKVMSGGCVVPLLPYWTQNQGSISHKSKEMWGLFSHISTPFHMLFPPPGTLFPSNWTPSNSATGILSGKLCCFPWSELITFLVTLNYLYSDLLRLFSDLSLWWDFLRAETVSSPLSVGWPAWWLPRVGAQHLLVSEREEIQGRRKEGGREMSNEERKVMQWFSQACS